MTWPYALLFLFFALIPPCSVLFSMWISARVTSSLVSSLSEELSQSRKQNDKMLKLLSSKTPLEYAQITEADVHSMVPPPPPAQPSEKLDPVEALHDLERMFDEQISGDHSHVG